MNNKEIGSEFWNIELNKKENDLAYLNIGKDNKLLFSGRTAIDFILKEIKQNNGTVYMPDYCCESMVIPFIDNGYNIKYYGVDLINKKYNIDLSCKCDVFFAMNYFGYKETNMDLYIEKFSNNDIITIEDITHRFLSKDNYCKYSNYLICSLRKWFPIISGGIAINVNNTFKNETKDYTIDNNFINKKEKAMKLKEQYIKGRISDKEEYLQLFDKTNKMFMNYKNKKIDDISLNILKHIDINFIKKRRIENAKIIENILKDRKKIKLLFSLNDGDVPLFVPVVLENRDEIKKKMIQNQIYCPTHWPNGYNINNEIYKKEISLVCDQRYEVNDICAYLMKIIKLAEG